MGFWRGVGYFISILFIIGGLLGALFTYGLSLIGAILGFIFIWMLRRSAAQERMEKHLEHMDPEYQQQQKEEELEEVRRKLEEDEKRLAELEHKKEKMQKNAREEEDKPLEHTAPIKEEQTYQEELNETKPAIRVEDDIDSKISKLQTDIDTLKEQQKIRESGNTPVEEGVPKTIPVTGIVCPKCGNVTDTMNSFCPRCGSRLTPLKN